MIKLLWKILKDERGIAPLVAGAAILGGSTLLGGLLGKKKEKVYDPYGGLRGKWNKWMEENIGTSTPYQYNPAFDIEQPAVEKAAESTIMGRLGTPPTKEFYTAQLEASKTQQIAREKERAIEEQGKEREMYNRLGLVSSTPWMQRSGEMGEESLMRQKDIETGMDIYGMEYGMEADRLINDIINQNLSQAQVLGQTQIGTQKWGQQMSMADLERMISEEMGYGSQAAGVLGQNPPQVSYQPNIWSQLGQTGQDIGSMMMMYNLLGGAGGKTLGSTIKGGVGGRTIPTSQFGQTWSPY